MTESNLRKKGRVTSVDAHIGKRLKQKRILEGISQEKLAESVDISFQQIQKYENGKNRISSSRLYEFAQILNIDINYFFPNGEVFTASPGFAERGQEPLEKEEDLFKNKEAIRLVKNYFLIKNEKLRKDAFNMIKNMAQSSE